MFRKLLFLFILMFLLESCYKDNNTSTNITVVEHPETIIEKTNVTGTIFHSDGTIPDIKEIRFNQKNAQSVKPYFYFEAQQINRSFEILNVELTSGHTLYYPLSNVANTFNKHQLVIPKIENVIPAQNSIYTYTFKSGLQLKFPTSSFFENTINIDDPTIYIEEIGDISIPGNKQAISINEELILLENSEIFYLGWTDSNTELALENKLETTTSKRLYYLDSFTGEWNEKDLKGIFKPGFYAFATATLANIVDIKVNHDIPSQDVIVKVQSEDQLYTKTILSQIDEIVTMVPKEEDFKIIIELNGIQLLETDHFSIDPDPIEVDVQYEEYETMQVKVSPRNCSSILDEYTILEVTGDNYRKFYTISQPSFEIIKPALSSISCRLINREDMLSTASIIYDTNDEIFLGRQFLCTEVEDEFLYFITEGHARILTNISTTYTAENFQIEAMNSIGDILFSLDFDASQIGEVSTNEINVILNAPNVDKGYKVNCGESEEGCGFNDFEIKLFNSQSDRFVKAIFEGEFWMESIQDNSVGYRRLVGEFQIKLP